MNTDVITIQGHDFSVPLRYKAGDVLKENEAKALNQTYHEALRNNFAGKVKAANEKAGIDIKADEYDSLPDDQKAQLQAELDAYAAEFQFNVRTGGGGTPRDPVMAEALVEARKALRRALKAAGHDLKVIDTDQIDQGARTLIEKNPAFIETARRVVEEKRKLAEVKIDLAA